MIGHTELRATLLEKASSLVQGFGGGLLVIEVKPPPQPSLLRVCAGSHVGVSEFRRPVSGETRWALRSVRPPTCAPLFLHKTEPRLVTNLKYVMSRTYSLGYI